MTIFNALWYLELVTDLENTSINKEENPVQVKVAYFGIHKWHSVAAFTN